MECKIDLTINPRNKTNQAIHSQKPFTFHCLCGIFGWLFFKLVFFSVLTRSITFQGGTGLHVCAFQGILSAKRARGRTGFPVPQSSEFPWMGTLHGSWWEWCSHSTAAGPGCDTAHVRGSSAWQRTGREQGKAEKLLQRGNWGHYSAGSRCTRCPRTLTPTIQTQSQHWVCTGTNPPRTRGRSRVGRHRDISQAACKGRSHVQGLTQPKRPMHVWPFSQGFSSTRIQPLDSKWLHQFLNCAHLLHLHCWCWQWKEKLPHDELHLAAGLVNW